MNHRFLSSAEQMHLLERLGTENPVVVTTLLVTYETDLLPQVLKTALMLISNDQPFGAQLATLTARLVKAAGLDEEDLSAPIELTPEESDTWNQVISTLRS